MSSILNHSIADFVRRIARPHRPTGQLSLERVTGIEPA
jgi:hypothetical protein